MSEDSINFIKEEVLNDMSDVYERKGVTEFTHNGLARYDASPNSKKPEARIVQLKNLLVVGSSIEFQKHRTSDSFRFLLKQAENLDLLVNDPLTKNTNTMKDDERRR
ncbi:hypothetical protein IEQ34_026815 [Dendrobium chrysotoxum]|uniref:Uncharacterized protein n=1 Tax=Dendrobium chrysotoxum TaxID=161865 RepID=A0AAV7FLD5_DENCH|nr:hypothetical protein IEQ34_026815 [Dendrobium chrysotoxum]